MQGTQVQNSHDPRLTPVGLCTHAVNDGINTTIYKMNVGSFHTHTHTHYRKQIIMIIPSSAVLIASWIAIRMKQDCSDHTQTNNKILKCD